MKIKRPNKADVVILIGKQSSKYSLEKPIKRISVYETTTEEVHRLILKALKEASR